VPKDNVIKLIQPGFFDDQLTEVLRNGARALLARAVEAEVADFLDKHADLKTGDGHQRVVRHGHLPEREVMTGIGPVAVRQPRVRDRAATATDPGRIRFSPSILPPYLRRSKSIETFAADPLPEGISTGDFSEALAAPLGKDAAGLSASAITWWRRGSACRSCRNRSRRSTSQASPIYALKVTRPARRSALPIGGMIVPRPSVISWPRQGGTAVQRIRARGRRRSTAMASACRL
jgi:hypothetical protein